MAYPSGDSNASGYPLAADGKASDAVAHSSMGAGDAQQLNKDLNFWKGASCAACMCCLLILVIDALLLASLVLMLSATSHQALLAFNWPLYPETALEGAAIMCGSGYEDAYERLSAYQPNGLAAYMLMSGEEWNMYLDVYGELELEVDDAEKYAERLRVLADQMQTELREGRAEACEDPIFCGGEFGDQKCEVNPNLNPLIETSGDTLTIGFNAEGLVGIEVLRDIVTCSSYEGDTGACDGATASLGEPKDLTILKELLAAAYGENGCNGADMRLDAAFLAGPSWRDVVDSTDHWLEHLKDGFAAVLDFTNDEDAWNALLDKMEEVEAREDGTGEIAKANFPRQIFSLWAGSWFAVDVSSASIDRVIDSWPVAFEHDDLDTHFEHPLPGSSAGGATGVFSEDVLYLAGINYAYLRDYRSPYADVHELWEGEWEDQIAANEAMRNAQLWADMIQDLDDDDGVMLTLVSADAGLPMAVTMSLMSEGISELI